MQIIMKSTLKQWLNNKHDMLVIDVLPKENYKQQHIPGAINIPFQGNDSFVHEVEKQTHSRNQRIVVYCANLHCDLSKRAAQELMDTGFGNVYMFEGGTEGWFGKNPA